MIHPALRAYQTVTETSLTGREAEAVCFRMLIDELEAASQIADSQVRSRALDRHQRLWSMIMKANILDNGLAVEEDRRLFVRLADQAQKYGIQAILDPKMPLTPLIEIAENVLAGLEMVPEVNERGSGSAALA
ncbi:flagellar biosynthesis regulator FlaF [Gluconacetobacter sp. Hr-1-5]|uniref:flagellar biosynthesis regulator FlaF n=1 Tax=Gluconacetobacter sp. Hr-1-5 TaxID=3395370 RepID=UPI003B51E9D1